STITSTLSATIASEFNSLSIISWLGSAYLIALATVQPLSGKLSDIFGRCSCLIFCLVFFAAGNAMCGFAKSKEALIIGRVFAGVGGGGCNSISTYFSSDVIPLRRRGFYSGLGGIVYAVGIGMGGVIGGALENLWGWRAAFLVMIPPTAISGLGVAVFCRQQSPTPQRPTWKAGLGRIDLVGSLVLTSALTILLYGLNSESADPSESYLQLKVAVSATVVMLCLFVFVETYHASEPIIPITHIRDRTVLGACLAGCFLSMAMYTLMFHVPLYFQLTGYSTRNTGFLLIPEPVGAATASMGVGVLTRITGRYGKLKVVILVLMCISTTGFVFSNLKTPVAYPEFYLFLNGAGFGGTIAVLLLALLSAVKHEEHATATAVLYTFRSVGATVGVTVSGIIFREVLGSQMVGHHPPDNIEGPIKRCGRRDAQNCPGGVLESYMIALKAAFVFALAMS
ncbi:MAG: hypothetical protein Q9214_007401, partial [Letrouitia sp. 1 TL-2023]